MKKNMIVLSLLFSIIALDAFAKRDRRGSTNDRNSTARNERHQRAERNRTPRPSRDRTVNRPHRPDRDRTVNRPHRPDRDRTVNRTHRPDRDRTVNRPHRPDRDRTVNRPHRPDRDRTINRPHRPHRDRTIDRSRRHRPNRTHYGTRRYHNPPRYVHRPYSRRYVHRPMTRRYHHTRRYSPNQYYRYFRTNYSSYIYLHWLLFPSTRVNGYYVVDNYPYYIHNGYRYRYSHYDTCNYQLIDKYTHTVERTFWGQICSIGYDQCANVRDRRNEREWDNRYFCAETYRDRNYNFNRPTYDDYYDDCIDYDFDTGVCYDY